MTFAFAAAGTGGHVYPALAVADALTRRGVAASDIVFFGGSRMEATTIPEAGYRFVPLEIRGLKRAMTKDNMALPRLVVRAAKAAREEMQRAKVDVVTVFGGYVSVPVAVAGRRAGAAVFVQEQNAVPGVANRLAARLARRVFAGFPAAARRLPRAVVSGNPLRFAFAGYDRDRLRPEALARYGLPEGVPVIGVLGGSLGARILNDAAIRLAADADAGTIAIVHLTGGIHYDAVAPHAERSEHVWHALPFESEMQHFYAACDVILSRAGALTMSELAVTGTPAIVVPYAAGTAGHQAANAAELEKAGATVVIPEEEIDRVPAELQQLVHDPARRRRMHRLAIEHGHPDAADIIAAELLEAADG